MKLKTKITSTGHDKDLRPCGHASISPCRLNLAAIVDAAYGAVATDADETPFMRCALLS